MTYCKHHCLKWAKHSGKFLRCHGWELSDIPVLMTSWVKVVFHIYSLICIKTSTCALVQTIFLLNYSCLRKNTECDVNKGLFHPKIKVTICRPAFEATRPENYTNDKHPLIYFIRLSVKDMEKHKGQINGEEKQSRAKFSAEKEQEAVRMGFSVRPCRLRQSWAETSEGWLFSWRGGN